jgi:hypothetical protein
MACFRNTNFSIYCQIVPAGNPGIDTDKTHHDAESTPLHEVSADIRADLYLLKSEMKRADVKGLKEFLTLLEE